MRTICCILMLLGCVMTSLAQPATVKVKKYGAKPLHFSSVEEWEMVHRPVIYNFFEREVYGRGPMSQPSVTYELLRTDSALNGKAVCKQVAMNVAGMKTPILILLYLHYKVQ